MANVHTRRPHSHWLSVVCPVTLSPFEFARTLQNKRKPSNKNRKDASQPETWQQGCEGCVTYLLNFNLHACKILSLPEGGAPQFHVTGGPMKLGRVFMKRLQSSRGLAYRLFCLSRAVSTFLLLLCVQPPRTTRQHRDFRYG